ncbi:hypothetical protein GGF43_003371, partial [Coemansia sp. RSA 2618]
MPDADGDSLPLLRQETVPTDTETNSIDAYTVDTGEQGAAIDTLTGTHAPPNAIPPSRAVPPLHTRTAASGPAHGTTQRVRTSLAISIPPAHAFVQDPAMVATPRTARSHEASPLTPLEERVFQGANETRAYNVFDDDSVLKMCDDDADRAASEDVHSHGWRIDNVIDRYGDRIASRSKRLARIVAHRKGSGARGVSAALPLVPGARRGVHHRSSVNGSSSTAGTASAASSPMPARPELVDPAVNRVQESMGGLVSKARLRMHAR